MDRAPRVSRSRLPRRWLLGAPGLAVLRPSPARSETYPSRPIRLIVGFAAGSTTDLLAREVAERLGERLGARLVVDNRAGAGGALGSAAAARAVPDGHTILFGTGQTQAVNVSLFPDLPYDPIRDFSPIARVAGQPLVFAVNRGTGVTSVEGFVAYARARPDAVSFASTGAGSSPHLAGATLARAAGLRMTHVPYNGGQVMADLIQGRVTCMLYPYPPLRPHIEAGHLAVLATTGTERSPWLPDVPTMIESGYPGFAFAPWYALYGPARMPEEAVEALAGATRAALEEERTRARLFEAGTVVSYAGPRELAAFTAAEIGRFRPIVEAAGGREAG